MKKVYQLNKLASLTFLSFLLLNFVSKAQITILSNDMPNVGDTFRLSNQRIMPGSQSIPFDLTQTGADFIWDFTNLESDTQKIDTFFSPSLQTLLIYNLVFTNIFDLDYLATLAQRSQTVPTPPSGGGGGGGAFSITIENAYDFMKVTQEKFEIVGNAFTINGVPSANKFVDKDLIYQFPLNYNDQYSSSTAYSIEVPSLGDYKHYQTRTNVVDGWGKLYTPYGGFDVLRVKSTIPAHDTIILSQFGFPFGIASTTTEYKWLAKNIGVPVLQINTRTSQGGFGGGGGSTTVTKVAYLDSLPHGNFHYSGIGINENEELSFEIYPNPVNDIVFLKLTKSNKYFNEAIIREISGKELFRVNLISNINRINLSNLAQGVYLVELGGKTSKVVKL